MTFALKGANNGVKTDLSIYKLNLLFPFTIQTALFTVRKIIYLLHFISLKTE